MKKQIESEKVYVNHIYKTCMFSYKHVKDEIVGEKKCNYCAFYCIVTDKNKKDVPYCNELETSLKNYNACSKFSGSSEYYPREARPSWLD